MHNLTCLVVKATGIGEVDFLRFDPIAKKAKTVKYDGELEGWEGF